MSQVSRDHLPQPSENRYVNKFAEWEQKYRILWSPAIYFEYFNHNIKPVKCDKYPSEAELERDCKPNTDWKTFASTVRAFPAYDYKAENTVVLQIKQKAIQKAIYQLKNDIDRWNPENYDIKIKRTWTGMASEYTATPSNKTEKLPTKIQEAKDKEEIDVGELVIWWNPFKNKMSSPQVSDDVPF